MSSPCGIPVPPLLQERLSRWRPDPLLPILESIPGLTGAEGQVLTTIYSYPLACNRWPPVDVLASVIQGTSDDVSRIVESLLRKGLLGRRRDGVVFPYDLPRLQAAINKCRKGM